LLIIKLQFFLFKMTYKRQEQLVEAFKQNFKKTNMMITSQKVQKVIIIITTDTSITLIHDYINKR